VAGNQPDLTREGSGSTSKIWMRRRWRTLWGKTARCDLHDWAFERAGLENLAGTDDGLIQLTQERRQDVEQRDARGADNVEQGDA